MMPKESFLDFFKDKTVTLLGLGLLGRGVGDAAFLARYCRRVIVTDLKNADELAASLEALKEYKNIEYVLGKHEKASFTGIDFVIKGAGVRLDNAFIKHAKDNKIPIYMSTALFAFLSPLKIIGVTGTRGKTTTTYMIVDILKRGGKKILLGGNIRGLSTLAFLADQNSYDYAVLELDSWQLQGFDDLKLSPQISVFTNFYPDHMNYYDGDMARYLHDKISIFRHQKSADVLITTQAIAELMKRERETIKSQCSVVRPLPSSFALKVPGAHNLINAALAKGVGEVCGIEENLIEDALHEFAGVEGRLQYAGAWNNRVFYNDSNATTQEATLAALSSFPPQALVLIFGGADKGLPVVRLISFIKNNKIKCVLIEGTGSARILKDLPDLTSVRTMREAVQKAKDLSAPNDAIILSPAFASFGVFKNEYDRSDQFMHEISELTGVACQH